jgi:hypothetical protein
VGAIQLRELRFEHTPTEWERALFEQITLYPFEQRDTVAAQLASCLVRWEMFRGDPVLHVRPTGHVPLVDAKAPHPVGAEAVARTDDGALMHFLLFVENGRVVEINMYRDDGAEITSLPSQHGIWNPHVSGV